MIIAILLNFIAAKMGSDSYMLSAGSISLRIKVSAKQSQRKNFLEPIKTADVKTSYAPYTCPHAWQVSKMIQTIPVWIGGFFVFFLPLFHHLRGRYRNPSQEKIKGVKKRAYVNTLT